MNLQELSAADKKFQKELNAGVTELVLLGVLSRATMRAEITNPS